MVERREKTKLAALQCWIETYKSVYQTLTGKNVPYSNRALERFSNALSPIQQPLSDAVGVPSSPEDPSILSPLRACPLPESFPLRKLPAKHHIRERNGPSHYLRRNIMQRVSVSNSPKNSDEPLTSGHCSLRGFVWLKRPFYAVLCGYFSPGMLLISTRWILCFVSYFVIATFFLSGKQSSLWFACCGSGSENVSCCTFLKCVEKIWFEFLGTNLALVVD